VVKARAEALLKRAKAGADFAELAKTNSEDEGSATNGGDLDYFGRGRMVPEFDQAAFAMMPGDISDLVKSQFGYHIIKVVDKKAAAVRTLPEVRQQIIDQLSNEMAQALVADLAQTIAGEISTPADLDKAAQKHGLTVQESGFFARDEPILTLGASPDAVAKAFEMKTGEVSGPLSSARGVAFETLTAVQPPSQPKIEEVKDKVREEVLKQKSRDLSRQKAAAVAARLKGAPDFEKAAKAAGVEAKSTELITRDAPVPDLGVAPEVLEAAFAMPVGAVSDPLTTDAGTIVFKVVAKEEVTPAQWASNQDEFRAQLLQDRRNRFFASYMIKAKQKMKIELNRETLQRTVAT